MNFCVVLKTFAGRCWSLRIRSSSSESCLPATKRYASRALSFHSLILGSARVTFLRIHATRGSAIPTSGGAPTARLGPVSSPNSASVLIYIILSLNRREARYVILVTERGKIPFSPKGHHAVFTVFIVIVEVSVIEVDFDDRPSKTGYAS